MFISISSVLGTLLAYLFTQHPVEFLLASEQVGNVVPQGIMYRVTATRRDEVSSHGYSATGIHLILKPEILTTQLHSEKELSNNMTVT